jgi:hypothetical protein
MPPAAADRTAPAGPVAREVAPGKAVPRGASLLMGPELSVGPEGLARGGWFTNREDPGNLDDQQSLLLAALIAMLDRVRPAQVSPEETALTFEGPGSLMAIVPHRSMAGLSIVARLDAEVIAVFWDQIGPYFSHDDNPWQGFQVVTFAEDADSLEVRCQKAVECVREQLGRPIEIHVTYAERKATPIRVEYDLTGEGPAVKRIAVVNAWFPWLYGRRRKHTYIARFTDDHAPPFVKPAAAHRWFR